MSTDLTYVFKKIKILTDPSITDRANVISKIYWQLIFTDNVSTSVAMGATNLNTSNLSNFTPIEQITDQMYEDWVIANQGGQRFIDQLKSIHGPIIERKSAEAKLVVYYTDESNKQTPFL